MLLVPTSEHSRERNILYGMLPTKTDLEGGLDDMLCWGFAGASFRRLGIESSDGTTSQCAGHVHTLGSNREGTSRMLSLLTIYKLILANITNHENA